MRAAIALFLLVALSTCRDSTSEAPPDVRPPRGSGLICGDTECTPRGEACCINSAQTRCVSASPDSGAAPACSRTDFLATCDGPEDCTSGQCCYGTQGEAGTGIVTCTFQCRGRLACHTAADCPGEAPNCCPGENGFRACLPTGCP